MIWLVGVLFTASALCAELAARAWRRDAALASFAMSTHTRRPVAVHARLGAHLGRLPGWAPWVVAAAIAGVMVRGPILGALASASAGCAWAVRARRRRTQTSARRDEQLADTVRAMSSSLRAGMSMAQAIGYAEGESRPPLRPSLEAMSRSLELGQPFDEVLDAWSRRVDTDDARLVTGILRLHRRSGGDLPAVLDQVAATLRERQAAAGEVRALTAQARLSGTILGVLPVGFFAFLWLTSRQQIEGAFHAPAGIAALVVGVLLEVLAFLWIRHLLEVR
jgi:tight adherence protein B